MNVRNVLGLAMLGFGWMVGCGGGEKPGPLGPFCGGIAGLPCPGAGECVDDPRDDCDPEAGGADCSGVCECNVTALCEEGTVWNDSPDVCSCVPAYNPCAAVLCPEGSLCVVDGDEGRCVPMTGESCGDSTCAEGMVCCNASCGICTPPGGVCIQIACE